MIVRTIASAAPTAGTPPVNHDIQIASGPGSDLTPKAALYKGGPSVTMDTSGGSYRAGFGMSDGTLQRALGALVQNNQTVAVAVARTRHDGDTVVQTPLGTSGAINGEANWDSWLAGGSRIAWGDLLSTAQLICPIYFFGSDVQAKVIEFTGDATVNTAKDTVSLGFAPDMVICYSHFLQYVADTDSTHARVAIGYGVKTLSGAIQQVGHSSYDRDAHAGTFAGASVLRDDRIIADVNDGADVSSLELTAMGSDKATFTTRDASPGNPIVSAMLFLGFGGRRPLYAGILPTTDPGGGAPWLDTSSAGNKTITVGFAPLAYFMLGTMLATKNSTNRTAGTRCHWSDGIWSGQEAICTGYSASDTQGVGGTRSSTVSALMSKVAHVPTGVSGTIGKDWEASHVSPGRTGPTINIDTASAAARLAGICVIGDVGQGWIPEIVKRRHKTQVWGPR